MDSKEKWGTLSRCGNNRIILSLRFYVKSKWVKLRLKIWHINKFRGPECWVLLMFALFEGCNLSYQQNSESLHKRAKMTVLDFLHTPKLISKKIFAQFYVKSILADFRRSKTVILTILESLNFELCQKFKVQELLKLSMSKWQCLELKNYQNWFHIKSEWQRNSENFHTVFTCWIIFIFRSSGRIILIHKLDPTFFVSHFKSFVTSLNFFFWG